jgi:regulator of replication initiation timing
MQNAHLESKIKKLQEEYTELDRENGKLRSLLDSTIRELDAFKKYHAQKTKEYATISVDNHFLTAQVKRLTEQVGNENDLKQQIGGLTRQLSDEKILMRQIILLDAEVKTLRDRLSKKK